MDKNKNESSSSQQSFDGNSKKRLILFSGLFILLIVAGIYVKQKFVSEPKATDASQESFQGPAELSTAVQQDCLQSAKEILNEVDCKTKDEKFFASLASCQAASYSTETAEGNFSDLTIHISECYFEKQNNRTAAIQILDKTQQIIPEWDVFQGPISCPSKPILSALKESYSDSKKFTCIKSADLAQVATKIQEKSFSFLIELVKPGALVQQGFIDSDASCPDTLATVEEILGKIAKNPLTAKEIVDEKPSEEKVNDRYIEIFNGSKKLLNLHFKIDRDDCLNFVSLLAESGESFE